MSEPHFTSLTFERGFCLVRAFRLLSVLVRFHRHDAIGVWKQYDGAFMSCAGQSGLQALPYYAVCSFESLCQSVPSS